MLPKKLPLNRGAPKSLFFMEPPAPSVQSIIGATDTFLSKVSGLAPILKSGYLLIAAILLQIPVNYTYAAALFKMHQPMAVARICSVENPHRLCRGHQRGIGARTDIL